MSARHNLPCLFSWTMSPRHNLPCLWQDRTLTRCVYQTKVTWLWQCWSLAEYAYHTKLTLWQYITLSNYAYQTELTLRRERTHTDYNYDNSAKNNTLTMTKQDSPVIYVYPTKLTLRQDRTHTWYYDKTVLKTSHDKTWLPCLPDKTHSMTIQDSYALCLEWRQDSPWQYPAWWSNETSSPAWFVRFPARPANNPNVLWITITPWKMMRKKKKKKKVTMSWE